MQMKLSAMKVGQAVSVTAAMRGKMVRDVKLKSGATIPKGTPVEIKWLSEHDNGHAMAQVVPEGFDSYKTRIATLHTAVSGFPKPPSVATMENWTRSGKAKTPSGQSTEPDGWGSDGSPSWLLAMGLI
jgi:hypothetical protein